MLNEENAPRCWSLARWAYYLQWATGPILASWTQGSDGPWRERGRTYSRRWEPGVLGCTCHSARHSPARHPGLRCPTAARTSSLAERGTKIKRSVLTGHQSCQLWAAGNLEGQSSSQSELHKP